MRVRAEVRRWTRGASREDQQDIEQEVWRAAWRGLPRYEHRAAITTWLTSIVRHVVISWWRRRRFKERLQRRLVDLGPEAAGRTDDAADLLLRHLSLSEAMGGIDVRFAAVLRLRYFEHLTDAEVAARLQLPLGTVKRRIHSGLKHLHTAMVLDEEGR